MEEEEISGKELLRPANSLAAAAAAASRLTDDLIVEILSRLPFRSVCRSKCVSKPWRDLIAHRKKLPQTLAGVLYTTIPGAGGYRYHLAGVSADADAEGLDLDPSLAFLRPTEYRHFRLEHACNGLLLCSYRPEEGTVRLVVCNPATQRWTELPPGPQPRPNTCRFHRQFHLAFDPAVPSHFQVFDFERTDDVGITGVSIYSSRTGAWSQRDIELDKVVLEHHSVLVDGMLHVVGNQRRNNSNNTWEDTTVLVAVDMEGKVWKTISMPRGQCYYTVGWSEGCLHYATISPVPLTAGDDDDEGSLNMAEEVAIWRLEDYDSQQWALKHSFRIDKVLNLAEVEYQLVGFHPDRDTFFFVSKGIFDGEGWDAASLVSWDMRRPQLSSVLDLEKSSVGPYLPYVPLFSSEPLADADGH